MNYYEVFYKYKKYLYLIGIILIIMLILQLSFNNKNSTENRIKNYIISKGFKLDSDEILYEKRISEITYEEYNENVSNNINSSYDILYFDIYNYQLNENIYEYYNKTNYYLSSLYDYTSDKITYNYRIRYETSNIIFSGSYQNSKFTCDTDYSFDAYIEESKSEICNILKIKIEDFQKTSMETITSTKILNDMKK